MDYSEKLENIELRRKELSIRCRSALGAIDGIMITTYKDICALDIKILKELASIETEHVWLLECEDEYIEGSTGGHHVEPRDIFNCALESKPLEECCADIYLNDDGSLCFDVHDRLKAICD